MKSRRFLFALGGFAAITLMIAGCTSTGISGAPNTAPPSVSHSSTSTTSVENTRTPIKHVVVIYDENISFDHYFGTYPMAANTDGVSFTATAGTPTPVNLLRNNLLTKNPNEFNPFRLTPSDAVTCDQNHAYGPEQAAADGGKNDKAVQFTSGDSCGIGGAYSKIGLTMGYFDGNTVTALWNYAQNYSLGDHSYSSTFGPSTPGALNLIAGQTHGMKSVNPNTGKTQSSSQFVSSLDSSHVGTTTGDADPAYDDCSNNNHTASVSVGEMTGRNIGDLLDAKGVTWGWFQGGFAPTTPYNAATHKDAECDSTHKDVAGTSSRDYVPHHNPFAFFASTSNPHHLPPSSVAAIGQTDQANHNYDLTDFTAALDNGVLPAVSFLKPAAYQNGHAANSDPLDEQNFLIRQINAIEKSKYFASTAIVVAYDDSDGWYDQLSSPVLNGSDDHHVTNAIISDQPACVAASKSSSIGVLSGYADRCGPGTRQPLLVISPWARTNFVDSTPTEQASILAFIENNWGTGRIGDGSFDARAGTIDNMFDFGKTTGVRVLLNPNGTVSGTSTIKLPASH